jgi:hypothetical protein
VREGSGLLSHHSLIREVKGTFGNQCRSVGVASTDSCREVPCLPSAQEGVRETTVCADLSHQLMLGAMNVLLVGADKITRLTAAVAVRSASGILKRPDAGPLCPNQAGCVIRAWHLEP